MIPLTEIVTGEKPHSIRAELASTSRAGMIKLQVAVLNITLRCPLRCIYCYSDSGKLNDLDYELALRFLEEFSRLGGRTVILSGGEPTLYPRITDIIHECTRLRLNSALSTCGIIGHDKVRQLISFGLRYIGISIDTGVPSLEVKLRPGIDLEKVVETARFARKHGIHVGIRATLTFSNIVMLENLFKLCTRLGISRLCLYFLVPSGRALKLGSLFLDSVTALKAVLHLVKLVKRYSKIDTLLVTNPSAYLTICLYAASTKEEFFHLAHLYSSRCKCNAALSLISLNVQGEILPCQFSPPSSSCGNINSVSIIEALEKGRSWVETHRCRACELSDLCYGCPVRLYVHKTTRDPACLLEAATKVETSSLASWKIDLAKRLTKSAN